MRGRKKQAAEVAASGVPEARLHAAAVNVPQLQGIGVDAARNFVHVDVRSYVARWGYRQGRQVALAEVLPLVKQLA